MWCTKLEIKHKLIPIGVKELNGKVDNTHGFDHREFYFRYLFEDLESLELNMRSFIDYWDTGRHTKKLGWQTPIELIEKYALNPSPPEKAKRTKRIPLLRRYLEWMVYEEKKKIRLIAYMPGMSKILPGKNLIVFIPIS